MKVLYMGDSITDAGRNRAAGSQVAIGQGYPLLTSAYLGMKYPGKFEFINNGISGNRIVDLYARIKADVWNHEPDVLSILIGVNDVWHEFGGRNGVETERFDKVYRMFIDDTLNVLPNIKIMILEPFVLCASATTHSVKRSRREQRYQRKSRRTRDLFSFLCKRCSTKPRKIPTRHTGLLTEYIPHPPDTLSSRKNG